VPKPLVAIVGRPNVGKSTLFNRLVGERIAIVADIPGTTRDRLYGDAEWSGREFTLVDTGGLMPDAARELEQRVTEQAELAIDEADVIIFLTDAIDGITEADREVADKLRRSSKPVLLAVNKAESESRRLAAVDFYELGLGDPTAISAIHGVDTGDLLDDLVENLPAMEDEEELPNVPRLAILGRPNVGKSSILNGLLGEERVIVDDVGGTTRDAIDTLLEHKGQQMLVIDTAGLRRRGKIEQGVEKYSVMRALRALDRAHVSLLVIDGNDGVTTQDAHVGGYIVDAAKGVVIVVNKWDLVPKTGTTMAEYTREVRERLKFLDYAPIVFVSAETKQRLSTTLDVALRVHEEGKKRIPTARLNEIILAAEEAHRPPSVRGKRLKIYYVTQAEVSPPTFVFFVNDPNIVHFSYSRYLENKLREVFKFEGNPLRFVFRGRDEEDRQSKR
jgi:GTPase